MEWQNVPTPDEIIDIGKKKFSNYGGYVTWIALALIIIAGLKSAVYSIGPDEVGVIQRFGKYSALSSPGLHAKIPFIDRVTPIKVEKIFKEEFGIRSMDKGPRAGRYYGADLEESLMLTGDLNILDVRWIVQFKIKDPIKLLFIVRDPLKIIRDVSEIVMRRFVGDYTVDEVLTIKREEIDHLAQVEMQKILDDYQTGVQVITVKLLDVNPPDKVKPAFNEVNEAKQEKEKMINQAWEAYNKAIPKARGEAERTIREAEGYSLDKINRAKGESDRFLITLSEYQKAPEITRKRLYLETLAEVLPKAKEKYVIDPRQSSILPLLDIGKKGGTKQ
ncbi:MAG: FtsH protease activity modulator HflK [Candidatus Omnitrophica bacterium]|nr:FtsH protease activity modulator HflK [Candidatus Omnitrophota bacterium]